MSFSVGVSFLMFVSTKGDRETIISIIFNVFNTRREHKIISLLMVTPLARSHLHIYSAAVVANKTIYRKTKE